MEITFNLPNWEKITDQTANFFYTESEKRHKELIDACQYNQDVAHRMLNMLLPIIVLTIGYLFSKQWNKNWEIMLPATVFISLEIIAIGFLMLTIRHGDVHSLGSNPRDMLKPELIIEDSDRAQYLLYIIGACEEMQKKIDYNKKVNNRRSRLNNVAMLFATILAPAGFLITSLLLWWW